MTKYEAVKAADDILEKMFVEEILSAIRNPAPNINSARKSLLDLLHAALIGHNNLATREPTKTILEIFGDEKIFGDDFSNIIFEVTKPDDPKKFLNSSRIKSLAGFYDRILMFSTTMNRLFVAEHDALKDEENKSVLVMTIVNTVGTFNPDFLSKALSSATRLVELYNRIYAKLEERDIISPQILFFNTGSDADVGYTIDSRAAAALISAVKEVIMMFTSRKSRKAEVTRKVVADNLETIRDIQKGIEDGIFEEEEGELLIAQVKKQLKDSIGLNVAPKEALGEDIAYSGRNLLTNSAPRQITQGEL